MKYLTIAVIFFSCVLYADNNKAQKTKTKTTDKIHYATPLVLDMDGDKKLQASGGKWLPHRFDPKSKTATFDINGDHFAEFMEWVGPNDGLLVRYEKGEMNGLNLFGDAGGFKHGFEKLSVLDKNNDKAISGEELKGLSVWQDKNGNAKVDKGEIKSVQSLKITSISVKHRMFSSSFVQDGKTKSMWDWHPAIQIIKRIRKN
ncbi:hypothetical protein [Candidatus Uabimicrobium amorphum]|uniref:FrpA/C n=1 Tax=Uabimicrobium amorphum TaxID=2596890 RepID=A0A5S9IJ01_UABAM|nr:hypothetical protein [Candidatus Uabimicrobium amorphum]BBM82427.1 FrpA/C [Candidatus Uabimicrobium amorphum]